MRQLLELVLRQIQGTIEHLTTLAMDISNRLAEAPAELPLEEQHMLEIGRQVFHAAGNNKRLADLYSSGKDHDGSRCFVHEDYASMIESLIRWEDQFDGKDVDQVLSVFEVSSDNDLDDSDELESFLSSAADAVNLYKRINDETSFDACSDADQIIEALNNSCENWEDVQDLVERAHAITRNW